MLSRLAQNLFWVGRYLERAESSARLINATTLLLLDLPRQTEFDWRALVEIVGADDLFAERYPDGSETCVMRFLTSDRAHPGSIASSVASARENLRSARDLIPREVWEEINGLHLFMADEGQQIERRLARSRVMDRVVHTARLTWGQIESGMSRDAAYDMLTLGMSIERADMTTRVIDVRSSDLLTDETGDLLPYQNVQWISVLKSLSAFQMYRRHVRTRVTGPGVVRFLLSDVAFPRSTRFCLHQAGARLARLPNSSPCTAQLNIALDVLSNADFSRLSGHRLSEFLDRMQIELNRFNDVIQSRYFQH
ncbi:alpha-E domain-containing protein [Salinisphaera aquimarina]|uniref:Alpha-E domain-containing protein n=1 Tax=Salinisphaera aquimarina TaxID=2094031 RepID=A0ABV7ELN9_9GAMM